MDPPHSASAVEWRPPQFPLAPPPPPPPLRRSNPISQPHTPTEKKLKRKSWLPGSGNSSPRTSPQDGSARPARAWICGQDDRPTYDLEPLIHGLPIPELWDETGDTIIYLFPKSSQRGPSIRLHSAFYASSRNLADLAQKYLDHGRSIGEMKSLQYTLSDLRLAPLLTPSISPSRGSSKTSGSSSASSRPSRILDEASDGSPHQIIIYLPITLSPEAEMGSQNLTDTDVETLIDVRNMFAFLVGQSLVASERRQTVFAVFMNTSKVLLAYNFTNFDASTFGDVAVASFDNYVDELNLGDVRTSREKTIEALVLGERMRSLALYNEAFVHAVGKYSDLQRITKITGVDTKFALVTAITRNRLERASIDLVQRQKSINLRLLDFDFPSIFAGVMSSKMVDERKLIRFDAWKDSFNATRKFVLSYLKLKYGSWPPKASSKKNDLETSGLNRIVLKALYFDFADVYDLYVDRTSLTTRSIVQQYGGDESATPAARILRRVFDEYDRSSPPVQPPIPFDLPIMPGVTHLLPSNSKLNLTEARKLASKKVSSSDLIKVLDASTNQDTLATITSSNTKLLAAMRKFEARHARGCTLSELSDLRAGMFIFIYAVLQSLPLLVIDAPGVKHHQGVEYFLCEPPRSGVPWAHTGSESSRVRGWYSVSGGAGIVSLPADLVQHGVEATYQRSHCWVMGARWNSELNPAGVRVDDQEGMDYEIRERADIQRHDSKHYLIPPTRTDAHAPSPSRSLSPAARDHRNRESAFMLGLEAMPLPPATRPNGSRAVSMPPATLTRNTQPSRGRERDSRLVSAGMRPAVEAPRGTTFDDILGGIAKEGKKGKK